MSMRHVRHLRRAGAATLMAAALALTATACGSDDGKDTPSNSSSSQGGGDQDKGNGGANADPGDSQPIATVKGDSGIDMEILQAKRDSGGFLTVSGQFKNTSGTAFTTPVQWSGQETDVKATGPSLAGMTLVDSKGRKRYYVLRDTDNRPLTTTDYASSIEAGKSLGFFAQFPAPPQSTTSVDLQFPGFPNTTIEIS
ncbi:hypothetical protein GCM10018793_25260 [Streptomyces sulfonofaciens]|uniref:Secreted protein n=1 Tax=Streptomyces sulfonofaciens TaxID=68272 RepID=A0A919G3A8_9ACTN|nr:hypothetical protein [Streptomyces sulfonofaciens]GHH77363.1 hypothetical protein GCM10018793_25260 [Streptomyces sulfonofaciens]